MIFFNVQVAPPMSYITAGIKRGGFLPSPLMPLFDFLDSQHSVPAALEFIRHPDLRHLVSLSSKVLTQGFDMGRGYGSQL